MNDYLLEASYFAASILFIMGLKALCSPVSARRGMLYAELGMLLAIVGTLLKNEIVSYEWIIVGIMLGSLIGGLLARLMPMTAMPQLVAISHAFGALAATLVGVVKFEEHVATNIDSWLMTVLGIEVLFGSLTITGSLIAFIKLQELITGAPITYRFQNIINLILFIGALGLFGFLLVNPATSVVFYLMLGAGLLIGVLLVLPIGGADMPVVLALLNSYAGLASAATGFAINNDVLIIAGALNAASGFFLAMIMSKAMNRSFTNVLFGAVGAKPGELHAQAQAKTVTRYTPEDVEFLLSSAQSVIIIPGYGMAVAQAQHPVQELGDLLMHQGIKVRYAIHPVAGRMPGHMNVLLAEANVSYDLLFEPDQINDEFSETDVVLVIGANDVINPAARYKKDSPLYGMPILDADKAHSVVILKRSLGSGFAGEDNELFYAKNTLMVFGDAKTTLNSLVQLLKHKEMALARK
ncbi:MAG: NAD(P)(+) transhydrogenase (Re/Si-specific) subunit beta [Chloroflexi bacterium]|uniref:NAD(P) transhydrogenase subunit beta n=1 Tax=Candidatus Chlorohelix allophototropha TaxID=3003348 RepID=A0A8T7M1J0_9CHLR|nr:NAD(P)(+) transhydrogenase (Re/Si-specific) subunit beta [Chloroflexota bacterium]WJW67414.1 NAD(P)(+) transhydrogenase (Re/Si-specific) subunit beta [Chloroflexota bacterium L227-S17]